MIANVKSVWVDGNIVFKTNAGTTIATFDAENEQLTVNTLAMASKATFVADVADAAANPPTDTEFNTAVAALNDVKAAIVSAGLMAAS